MSTVISEIVEDTSPKVNQIISNFKLFSKNKSNLPNLQSADVNNMQYGVGNLLTGQTILYLMLVLFSISIILFIYFQRNEMEGLINNATINDMLGKLWINTHLTSAGELASTYVPKDFFNSTT